MSESDTIKKSISQQVARYREMTRFNIEWDCYGEEPSLTRKFPLLRALWEKKIGEEKLEDVKKLVAEGIDVKIPIEIPVVMAANLKLWRIVRYLVDNGADINVGAGYLFVMAAQDGCLETVKYLKEKGIDLSPISIALRVAEKNCKWDVIEYLRVLMIKIFETTVDNCVINLSDLRKGSEDE